MSSNHHSFSKSGRRRLGAPDGNTARALTDQEAAGEAARLEQIAWLSAAALDLLSLGVAEIDAARELRLANLPFQRMLAHTPHFLLDGGQLRCAHSGDDSAFAQAVAQALQRSGARILRVGQTSQQGGGSTLCLSAIARSGAANCMLVLAPDSLTTNACWDGALDLSERELSLAHRMIVGDNA